MEKPIRKYAPKSVHLMDHVCEVLRFHHYAYNTYKSYVLGYYRIFVLMEGGTLKVLGRLNRLVFIHFT